MISHIATNDNSLLNSQYRLNRKKLSLAATFRSGERLINQGKILLDSKLEKLKNKFREDAFYVEVADDLSFIHDIQQIEILEEHNKSCKIAIKEKNFSVTKLLQIVSSKSNLIRFIQVEPSLHDIFIKVVQSEIKE